MINYLLNKNDLVDSDKFLYEGESLNSDIIHVLEIDMYNDDLHICNQCDGALGATLSINKKISEIMTSQDASLALLAQMEPRLESGRYDEEIRTPLIEYAIRELNHKYYRIMELYNDFTGENKIK